MPRPGPRRSIVTESVVVGICIVSTEAAIDANAVAATAGIADAVAVSIHIAVAGGISGAGSSRVPAVVTDSVTVGVRIIAAAFSISADADSGSTGTSVVQPGSKGRRGSDCQNDSGCDNPQQNSFHKDSS